jgi:hypothetical protein
MTVTAMYMHVCDRGATDRADGYETCVSDTLE